MTRGERFYVCPRCRKRGVSYRMTSGLGDDHWACRYCDWFAYAGGDYRVDLERRKALAGANPDREVWVSERIVE